MRRTRSRRFVAVLVSTGAMLALGVTAFAEAPAIDPCKFVTPAEVESVMGKKLKGAPALKNPVDELLGGLGDFVTEVTGSQERACSYEFTTSKSTLKIMVMPWETLTQRPKPTPSAGSSEQVKVNGLGDEAMLDRRRLNFAAQLKALWGVKEDGASMDREESSEMRTLALVIRKGKLAMLIEISDDTVGDEEKLKALGKKAVGRW